MNSETPYQKALGAALEHYFAELTPANDKALSVLLAFLTSSEAFEGLSTRLIEGVHGYLLSLSLPVERYGSEFVGRVNEVLAQRKAAKPPHAPAAVCLSAGASAAGVVPS